tara:strand:- start:206 stop:463 length:258 start_codon:yes stop_codon:yes gene_type:complete
MKKLLINIWAYSYHARFQIEHAEDNAESVENAIVDKLGENSIKWEYLGNNYSTEINRITYEEVIDDTRPIQSKKVLGVEVGTRAY